MFFRPKIERDPNIQKLEQEVFAKMQEIVKLEPSDQNQATSDVEFVSFEQALRELHQMHK
jgi:predicted rRNA methylase YqxC with S4 and FtsJ domains